MAKQLDDVARDTERPRSFIMQKALETYLEDYANLSEEAMDRLSDRTDPSISGKQMRKSLGL